MNLIDDPNDTATEIIDAAGEMTAAAADVAIEGAQSLLGSSRRLKGSALAVILVVALAALGYRRWRSTKNGADETPKTSSNASPVATTA